VVNKVLEALPLMFDKEQQEVMIEEEEEEDEEDEEEETQQLQQPVPPLEYEAATALMGLGSGTTS
jgi:hypothetical protein